MSDWNALEQVIWRPEWWLPGAIGFAAALRVRKRLRSDDRASRVPLWAAVSALGVTVTQLQTAATRAWFYSITGAACGSCCGIHGSYRLDLLLPPVYFMTVLLVALSASAVEAAAASRVVRWTLRWWLAAAAVLWVYAGWSIFYPIGP